jgi:DNA modification methylase
MSKTSVKTTKPKTMSADKRELFNAQGESRGFYSTRNTLNELTGKEWVYWSKSVINKVYPPNCQHALRSQHGAQKPPDLCADLIRIFTKQGETVLDPFAGVGGTLLGAAQAGRKALGIELNPRWIEIYHEVCRLEKINTETMLQGDSLSKLDELKQQHFQADFLLTDVPYWQMDKVSKSKGKFKKVGEEGRANRQSKLSAFNATSYPDKATWLLQMELVFRKASELIKPKKYLAVFIGDMYFNKQYHFLTADLAQVLQALNLTMKANIVWYDVSKALHVYGYLYEYIPSLIHQNVLIFYKEH